MSNRVAVVNVNTYSYKDQDKIDCAVNRAIDLLELPCDFIKPGMTVLIKPNLVMDKNHNPEGGTECLYTQASVVRPVIEYVISKVGKSGRIIIGDAPMQECVFDNIKGYKDLVGEYASKGYNIKLVDFRGLKSQVKRGIHYSELNENTGIVVNLGEESEFYGGNMDLCKNMRVTNYDPRILPKHHHGELQEYYVSREFLAADIIINMPKPKSHRKAGFTGALKNLVGINVRKEYLPHHTLGSKKENGDEYLDKNFFHSLRSRLLDKLNIASSEGNYKKAKLFRLVILPCSLLYHLTRRNDYDEGSWYGNNTIPKTIVDLNRIAIYSDKEGKLCDTPQRKIISIGDMIISGEKEGPVCPSPKNVGIVVAATNSYAFDKVVCKLMGFDKGKIPVFEYAEKSLKKSIMPGEEIVRYFGLSEDVNFHFEPTSGWKGHIERVCN